MTDSRTSGFRIKTGMLVLLFVATALPMYAQKPQRDPLAVATISKAIAALGFAPGGGPMSVRLTGSVSPTPGSEEPAGTFTSVVELSESGYQVRNEFEYADDGKQTLFIAGRKGAGFAFGKRVINMSAHLAMITGPSQMPILELIRATTNAKYHVSGGAPMQIGATSALHIKTIDETDIVSKNVTPQDWYFDPVSGLPMRWEFQVPDTFNATAPSLQTGAKEFSNWQTINGMLLPMQLTYFRDGHAASVTTIRTAEFGVQISESAFDLPKGAN